MWFALLLLPVFFLLLLIVKQATTEWKYRKFEGLTSIDFLLHFKSLQSTLRNKWDARKPKLLKLNLGPGTPFIVATHPETAKIILSDTERIVKSVPFSLPSVVNMVSGNILFSNGDDWKRFRHDLSSDFHYDVVKKWIPDMLKFTTELMHEWENISTAPIEMCDWIPLFTMDVLGKTVMGQHFNLIHGGGSTIHDSLKHLTAYIVHPKTIIYTMIERLTRRRLPIETNDHIDSLYNTMKSALLHRKNDPTDSHDLINSMLKASSWSENERIANTFILFVAGHETTARALLWLIYNLVSNQNIQQKLHVHIESVLGDQPITAEKFKELHYLSNVIKENMRISPPVPLLFSRVAKEEVLVDGEIIPAGTKIGVSPHIIHHDPAFWPDPDTFDPDRFDKPHNPFAYLPFSLKSRACLGSQFSMVEQTVFAATFVQHFELTSIHSFSRLDNLFNKLTELKIMMRARRMK